MLDKIRLATPDEIKSIESNSNLTPACSVWKMGEITGVYRMTHELDPVHFNGAPLQKVYKFLWGMENMARGAGVTEIFFNTAADDPHYHRILQELGAERTSKQPDYRWRLNL